jgi:hypothetical protein
MRKILQNAEVGTVRSFNFVILSAAKNPLLLLPLSLPFFLSFLRGNHRAKSENKATAGPSTSQRYSAALLRWMTDVSG